MEIRKRPVQSSMRLVQQFSENRYTGKIQLIFEVLLTVSLSVGCWYTFFSMFPSPISAKILIPAVILFPAGLYFLCKIRPVANFMIFYLFLLIAVYFVFTYNEVWNGLLVMANIVVETLNNQLGLGSLSFETSGDVDVWGRHALMAILPILLLVSGAIGHSVHHKQPVLAFVFTGLPVVTGLCLKASPSIWLTSLLLLSWSGLFLLSFTAKPDTGRAKKPLYIQNEKQSLLPFLFLGIAVLVILAYVLLFSEENYRPPETVDAARDVVIRAEEQFRYEKGGRADIDGLSQGDLTKTHPIVYEDIAVFRLKMQQCRSMYLRGFSGGYYENQKWQPLPEQTYSGEFKGIMEWLAQEDFYPWMQMGMLYEMAPDFDYATVNVENVSGSSKYMYLPYEAALAGEIMADKVDYQKDWGAFTKGLFGDRTYEFTAFLSENNTYDLSKMSQWLSEIRTNSKYQEYLDREGVYRRFVYQSYLVVPEKDIETLSSSGIDQCVGKTPEYVLHYIQKLFSEQFTFDVNRGKAPEGKDELDYFMNTSRAGNDMHFATAAALMFRQAGIPSRYAEGYYLSPDTEQLYEGMANVKLDVLDSQAHGWVEIYIDEIGWVPVEVVPGYFTLDKKETQEKEEDSKIKEKKQKLYHDQAPENQQPDSQNSGTDKSNYSLYILLLILLLAAVIYQVLGRYRVKKRTLKFETVFTEEQAYAIYRYISKLMAMDGFHILAEPYENAQEVGRHYDRGTDVTFSELLQIVYKMRFGQATLTEKEHKKMALYAKQLSSHIYGEQTRWKRFLMKFIFFYV